MGRPLGPGGSDGLFKVLRYLRKNEKNKGRLRQRNRNSDNIVSITMRKHSL